MRIALLFSLIAGCFLAKAQDAIVFKSGDTIVCKIVSVDKSDIRFRIDSMPIRFAPLWTVQKYEYNVKYKPTQIKPDTTYRLVDVVNVEPFEKKKSELEFNSWDFVHQAGENLSNGIGLMITGTILIAAAPLCILPKEKVQTIYFPYYDNKTGQMAYIDQQIKYYDNDYSIAALVAVCGIGFDIVGYYTLYEAGQSLEKAGKRGNKGLSFYAKPSGATLAYRF